MITIDALLPALDSFKDAVGTGADREVAFAVALAKVRAALPLASEWEVRSLLVRALAAERTAARKRPS